MRFGDRWVKVFLKEESGVPYKPGSTSNTTMRSAKRSGSIAGNFVSNCYSDYVAVTGGILTSNAAIHSHSRK